MLGRATQTNPLHFPDVSTAIPVVEADEFVVAIAGARGGDRDGDGARSPRPRPRPKQNPRTHGKNTTLGRLIDRALR